jgi:hypothetical protein
MWFNMQIKLWDTFIVIHPIFVIHIKLWDDFFNESFSLGHAH